MAKRHSNEIGNLESIFLRLEELVLANSGEDEFEEIFKLVIAKVFDERSQKNKRFVVHAIATDTSEAVNSLLQEANVAWPGILVETQSHLTPEHLAVCVDALSRHVISNDHMDILDAFFEFMVSKDSKGSKGQFFTPRHVIELCVKMMRPKRHEIVMDPACGSGGFLAHTLNYLRQTPFFLTRTKRQAFFFYKNILLSQKTDIASFFQSANKMGKIRKGNSCFAIPNALIIGKM